MSSFYLPLIAIFPQKFCALFSLGSIAVMISLAFMVGTTKFLKALFNWSNIWWAILYTVSLILGIYFSCINKSYILVIILSALQFVSLSYLLLANIPYGRSTLNILYKTVGSVIKKMCGMIFRKMGSAAQEKTGGILPF